MTPFLRILKAESLLVSINQARMNKSCGLSQVTLDQIQMYPPHVEAVGLMEVFSLHKCCFFDQRFQAALQLLLPSAPRPLWVFHI